jgi:catechol 2,3-dioxygenase-like lactoylglutathione lyase family enzyme
MASIRHIAFFTDDPEKLAEFYIGVFGMKRKLDNPAVDEADDSSAVWITDGYMEIALIRPGKAGTPRGINHFGFTLDKGEKEGVYQRLAERGSKFRPPQPNRPYVEEAAYDCDGNRFDLSTSGLRMDEGVAPKDGTKQ